MPPTPAERSLYLHPLVPASVQHNTQTISQIRSLTSLLLGIAAGILGLESQWGFLFYFLCQTLVSALIHVLLARGRPGWFFQGGGSAVVSTSNGEEGGGAFGGKEMAGAWRDIWLGSGVFEGLSGFVLGWAGVGGVVR